MNDAWIRLVCKYTAPNLQKLFTAQKSHLTLFRLVSRHFSSEGSMACGPVAVHRLWSSHSLVNHPCPRCERMSRRAKVRRYYKNFANFAILMNLRTSAFSQIRFAKLLSQLLFVPLGGALIAFNPWLPMWIGTGFQILGILSAIILVPSDRPLSDRSEGQEPLLNDAASGLAPTKPRSIGSILSELSDWAMANSRLIPLVFSFFVFQLGEQAGLTLLLQYAAKRLHWTLSKVCLLYCLHAGTTHTVFRHHFSYLSVPELI